MQKLREGGALGHLKVFVRLWPWDSYSLAKLRPGFCSRRINAWRTAGVVGPQRRQHSGSVSEERQPGAIGIRRGGHLREVGVRR
jgi:hypothetical protein